MMMSRPLVLVAGATGVIGSEVVKLLRSRGHRIRALTRDPARTKRLLDFAARVFTTDCAAPRTGKRRLAEYFIELRNRSPLRE